MQVKLKVWFEQDGKYVFGDGRMELLSLIGQFGSIKEAASALKMSYRHAWGQLRRLEECVGFTLVETRVGGKGGGETNLTEAAKKFLSKYDEFRSDLAALVQERYKGIFDNPDHEFFDKEKQ